MYLILAILYILLFNLFNKQRLNFKLGFLFGLFYSSIYTVNLIKFVFQFDFKFLDLFIPIFIIFYYAFSMGVYFYLLNIARKFIVAILLSYLYIYWLVNYSCFIFGSLEGLACLNPFIFLMGSFAYRKLLYFLGTNFFIIFFLIIFYLVSFNKYLTISCLGLLLFLDFYFQSSLDKPSWLNSIACAHIEKDYKQESDIEYLSYKIKEKLLNIKINKPEVSCIIMPESTFEFNLNYCPRVIKLLSDSINGTVILGAHRICDNGAVYNTAYVVNKEGVLNFYDKKHRIFWVERVPFGVDSGLFGLSCVRAFDKNINQEIVEFDILGKSFVPRICSELFFNQSINYRKPILALVNDSWCFNYMQKILFYTGIFQAISCKAGILYVSYSWYNFINMYGDLFKI